MSVTYFLSIWETQLILTLVAIKPYAWMSPRHLVYSRLIFLTSSLLRTGIPSKRLLILTTVPLVIAVGVFDLIVPSEAYSTRTPVGDSPVDVVTVRLASAQSDDRASPRKPNERTRSRSLNDLSLEV